MPIQAPIHRSERETTLCRYLSLGFSVLPLARGSKYPCDSALLRAGLKDRRGRACWKPLQTRQATAREVEAWLSDGGLNFGLVTGYRDLYALDFDHEDRYQRWTRSCPAWAATLPTQRTGHGYHVLFKSRKLTATRYRILMPAFLRDDPAYPDVAGFLGRGTWMTAAPSLHDSGRSYTWLDGRAPWEADVPEIPDLADLNLRLKRPRSSALRWLLRCVTAPGLARSQLSFYLLRRRGIETHRNRSA